MSSLLVFHSFYRVEWSGVEIQSACLYFVPSFVNYCPSNLLQSQRTVHIYNIHTLYRQCVAGAGGVGGGGGMDGGGRGFWVVLKTIFCRSLTLCFWPGSQTDKHLPQSPFTGQFFLDNDIWHCFYQSNLSTAIHISVSQVVCRWFRFAQLAKGKKFRP